MGLGVMFFFCSLFNFNFIFYFGLKSVSFLKLTFFFDYMSFQFLGVLLIIVGSVLIFSLLYMENEVIRYNSFLWVLYLFVLSMVFLMISGDWLVLILGWDWLGISSFFLVAFYKSDSSWSGSFKTYFTKRLGDGFFLLILSFLLLDWSMYSGFTSSLFLSGFLILLTQTKSAQIPFSAWLPAAMAAPTPVSALVHSSTLVTAGMFILMRLMSSVSYLKFYMAFMGLLTLFIGSISACGSMDMKKVVAFSTLSHLGFMVVCLSSGLSLLAFFHLIVHASFKALLFMCVGSLMVFNNHAQDLRQVSFNKQNMFFMWGASMSVISLCGFPYFSGFFSKDFIIEYFFWNFNMIFFLFFLLSLILSVIYSGRLVMSFLNVKWVESSYSSDYHFYYWYYLPLLFFSVSLGMVKSSYCLSFYLVGGTLFLKVVMYSFLLLGVILLCFRLHWFPLLSSSMSFLDSLGPYVALGTYRVKMIHQYLDLGVLPYISEYSLKGLKEESFSFFWKSLGGNVFYYLFFLVVIFILF